ncbi:MAG TPA: hypothetical protein VHW02_00260 [Rhizomicrobium sp.]|jgi:hypothetical protein|nr:hypothetical protein [Rhizomicrobium sp.]
MRCVAAFLIALAFACAANAGDLPPLKPQNGTVLAPDHARDVLHQCSRGVPPNVQGVWTPSAQQIRELEARLPGALLQEMAKRGHPAPPGSPAPFEFGRQYAGFVTGGRRIVYVNAFPLEVMNQEKDWRTRPAVVCDGGEAFFGVEYDPATKTFANFAFNGFA